MRSKQPFSAAKPAFVIFLTLLLASAIVPTQAQAQTFKVLHTFHGAPGETGRCPGLSSRETLGAIFTGRPSTVAAENARRAAVRRSN